MKNCNKIPFYLILRLSRAGGQRSQHRDLSPEAFNKAWQHIWDKFEETGANQYATWMIEWYADTPFGDYYPGDKYVDWVGLSCQNWLSRRSEAATRWSYADYRQLSEIIEKPMQYLGKYTPSKPVMIAEFSTTAGRDQPEWMMKAYQAIKAAPSIKAAICLDTTWPIPPTDDLRLTADTKKAMREMFKDPYWLVVR